LETIYNHPSLEKALELQVNTLTKVSQLIIRHSIGVIKIMEHLNKREDCIQMLRSIQDLNGLGLQILIRIHRFGVQLVLRLKHRSKEILETVGSCRQQLLWLKLHIAFKTSLHRVNIQQLELLKLSST
jgi:hypothetical protein